MDNAMDTLTDDAFPLAWCTLPPTEIPSPAPTFTILVGPPASPKAYQYRRSLVMQRSLFFKTMFKHANMDENTKPDPFLLEQHLLLQRLYEQRLFEQSLLERRSPPAAQERFEDPKACFREAVDNVVNLTHMEPDLILTYMYIIDNGGYRFRSRWTQNAAGMDMVFKLYILADYFMDDLTKYSLVPEMKRLTGLQYKPIWKDSDRKTPILRIKNQALPVPSVDFIWAIYEDVAPPSEYARTSARDFLREYFSAVGAAKLNPEQALPEAFVVDLVDGLQDTRLWLEMAFYELYSSWTIFGTHLMEIKVLASGLERHETWRLDKWQTPQSVERRLQAGFKFRKIWEDLVGKIKGFQKAYPELEYEKQEKGMLEQKWIDEWRG